MSFDVDAYLGRIAYDGDREPTLANLAALQYAHLRTVPFENLYVFHRVGVEVGEEWSYRKIVEQRRGGWCFELNGGFAGLLRRLGYPLSLLSCRVFADSAGELGPDLDHLALAVAVEGRDYLVDVGFGDNALSPIPLEPGEYDVWPRRARIEREGDRWRLVERMPASADLPERWLLQFEFQRVGHELADFAARSNELQTTPGLSWTERRFATRALSPAGARVYLLTDRLRHRRDDGTLHEQPVASDDWARTLREHFDLDVPVPRSEELRRDPA
jgi:N-hydroxyarylamine O-acetyltransferase